MNAKDQQNEEGDYLQVGSLQQQAKTDINQDLLDNHDDNNHSPDYLTGPSSSEDEDLDLSTEIEVSRYTQFRAFFLKELRRQYKAWIIPGLILILASGAMIYFSRFIGLFAFPISFFCSFLVDAVSLNAFVQDRVCKFVKIYKLLGVSMFSYVSAYTCCSTTSMDWSTTPPSSGWRFSIQWDLAWIRPFFARFRPSCSLLPSSASL